VSDPTPSRTPTPLLVAAVVVAVQGVGLVVLAVVGLVDLVPSRIEVGVSVSVFFAVYGAALVACAWALVRRRGWARGPVMLTQLIQLGLAWNTREDPLLAVPLAVTALVALVAMVQPASMQALLGVPDEEPEVDRSA
jgi:hypothetical protein